MAKLQVYNQWAKRTKYQEGKGMGWLQDHGKKHVKLYTLYV